MNKKKLRRRDLHRQSMFEYMPSEMDAIEGFLKKNLGDFDAIVHDAGSAKLHVDVILIPPNSERPYWNLVTMGMGKYRMKVPKSEHFEIPKRIELVLKFEPNEEFDSLFMDIGKDIPMKPLSADEMNRIAWPILLLKDIAQIPIDSGTYLAPFHTIDMGSPYPDSKLCGAIIEMSDELQTCTLPNGEEVYFYEVVPIYRNEMEYLCENGIEGKLKFIPYLPETTSAKRPNVLRKFKRDNG